MSRKEHSPHKKLFSEWTDRGVVFMGIVLILLGLGMALLLAKYPSNAPVIMWSVTWYSLTFIVLWRAKKSVSDPGYHVDKKIIDRTRKEIDIQRQHVRKELLENELKVLCRGEKTAVLDIWRLDQSLAKRHWFFTLTTSLLMDPQLRELQVRIQVEELCKGEERKTFLESLPKEIASYLRIISKDAYLYAERLFFDHVILVIDSLHEDERHVDIPYPILSISVGAAQLWSIAAMQDFGVPSIRVLSNIRFDNGNEIEPHRVIDLPASRGLK
jgi:hypothetical protein